MTIFTCFSTQIKSGTLLQSQLSSVEGHAVAMVTVKTLKSLRTEENFDLFWQKLEKKQQHLDIDEPAAGQIAQGPKEVRTRMCSS